MKRIAAAVLALIVTSSLHAASLVSIGVLDPSSGTTAYSEPRAVSQDGSFVVGTSQAPGGTIRVPVVWSASNGLVTLPNPSGANSIGIGVSVGVGGNAGNICITGLHEGNLTHRYYIAPLSNLTGGSWADCAAAGGWPVSDLRGGGFNDLRNAVPDNAGWPPLGNFYTGSIRTNGRAARLRANLNTIGWDGTTVNNVTSVSAYGVVVGRTTDSPSFAFYESSATGWGYTKVPGSTGARADGIGISSSFGKNTSGDYDVQWICGQVLNYNGTNAQGFRWKLGDASMQFLGTMSGHTSSCAYTVADTGLTAGRSYISGGETAVVWDTSGIWDTTGTAKSLKALLDGLGVDTSAWSSLVRVYAASDDGSALTGIGIWAADGSTRGFVAYPGPIVIKGGCCVATGLGTGTCSMVTRDECTTLGGKYLGDFVPCGTNNVNCGGFCPVPFADADFDGDVDQADFGVLQACITGIDSMPLGVCACLDRVKDGKIDSEDLVAFEKCATGPNIPWSQALTPNCSPGNGQLP